MNHRCVAQQMIGLTLVILLLVGGCVPATTLTPDRVATGVAEAKAIAATLTVEAPTATPTATATDTPTPIATAVPSTRASVPTDTPTPSPTAIMALRVTSTTVATGTTEAFVVTSETVSDTSTGLMWHKADIPLPSITGYTEGRVSFEDVKLYVESLRTGGYSDWRLPVEEEFKTIKKVKDEIGWLSQLDYSVDWYFYLKGEHGARWRYQVKDGSVGIRPVRGGSIPSTATPTAMATNTPAPTATPTPTNTPMQTPTSTTTAAYTPTNTPTPSPTPSLPAGTIRGVLINASSGKPLSTDGGWGILVAIIAEEDPNTGMGVDMEFPEGPIGKGLNTNARGEFTVDLSEIRPGKYFLILFWSPPPSPGFPGPSGQAYLLRDKDGQKVAVDLTQEHGTDVGEIFVVK